MTAPVFRVCFVCSGNICRSPMGEAVLRKLADDAGVAASLEVDSAGTGDWHIGEPADPRTVTAVGQAGYAVSGGIDVADHRARQFEPAWFAELDLVIAMDEGHARALRSWAPQPGDRDKVRLLMSFADPGDGQGARVADVSDPYYGDETTFAEVLRDVERGCRGVLAHAEAAAQLQGR